MKNINLILSLSSFIFSTFFCLAQQPPTGSPINQNSGTPSLAANAWYRGGNLQGNTGGSKNILGTAWNSPIYFLTGGTGGANIRMKLNADFTTTSQYPINGFLGFNDVKTSGYLLLGQTASSMANGQNIYDFKGAYSLLHLNGRAGSVQEFGYRPWMKTGVTFTDNEDLSYFGLRKLSTNDLEEDLTETVIMWSDNEGGLWGNDKLAFRFSGYNGADQFSVSNDFNSSTDMDGRNVAQFTGKGLFGLGNTFGTDATGMAVGYIDPQSLMHMSYAYRPSPLYSQYGFMQITYRDLASPNTVGGFGETQSDGLRLGIDNTLVNGGLNGYLRWQEATPFIVQSDWDNQPGGTNQGERLRVSSTSAPGVPATLQNVPNTTRVSVSYLGNAPVTQPRALLHLGSNTATFAPWMDNGMLVSNGIQSMYTGTTPLTYSDPGKNVVGFGRSDLLFMNTTLGELGRFVEATGYLGVGNYGPNGVINAMPSEKLDVEGNARFRDIPSQGGQSILLGLQNGANANDVELSRLEFPANENVVLRGDGTWGPALSIGADVELGTDDQNLTSAILVGTLLTIDIENGLPVTVDLATLQNGSATDDQDLTSATLNGNILTISIENGNPVSVDLSSLQVGGSGSNTGAHNGLSTSQIDPSRVSFGQSINQAGDPGQLLSNREIPLNNQSIYFTDNNANGNYSSNKIGIGTTNPWGKLSIISNVPETNPISLHIENTQTPISGSVEGIFTLITGSGSYNRGVSTRVENAAVCIGVDGSGTGTDYSAGGVFQGNGSSIENHGVKAFSFSNSSNPARFNYGIETLCSDGQINYGGKFAAVNNSQSSSITNYGVHSRVYGNTSTSWAGYFEGKLHASGQVTSTNGTITTSDVMFKSDVMNISGALSTINSLQPKTYNLKTADFEYMGFDSTLQMGFIANEVEKVLPNIVHTIVQPNRYDSLGNVITNQFSYKGIEYQEMIPLLVAGMKEQNAVISNKDSLITNLNERLTNLENCLENILPMLCQMSHSKINENEGDLQKSLMAKIEVVLKNPQEIVLNQNVPNPFAEQTSIQYSIPTFVQNAIIHFHDNTGKHIKSVEILERGLGSLTIYGSDLSKGMYTYSLEADGALISTKKMVKQ